MLDKEFKAVYVKTETGDNCLELSSVYPNNCSEQGNEIVSDRVIEEYNNIYKQWDRTRAWKYRNENKKIYLGNEDFEGKLNIVANSHDEYIESEMYLEYIKRYFSETVYRRGMMKYWHNYTEKEIAKIENVSQAAVSESIIAFKKTMSTLYNIDNDGNE